MKSIRYILFALSLPLAVSVSAQQVAGSQVQIENKAVTLGEDTQLLEIIDSDLSDLDAKDYRLKTLDAPLYSTLLRDCYPALRHTDYEIDYSVRSYNVEEAKQLLKTRPQLLSLEEMYLVAQTYEGGSEEFNEVFDIAVRMFPDDPTANINAAAMELKRDNVDQAVRYLERSDKSSPSTQNNQGAYHLMKGELDKAEVCFNKAKEIGSTVADANLKEVSKKRADNRAFGDE